MGKKKISGRKSENIEISKNNQLIRKGAFFKFFNLLKETLDKIDKK